MDLGQVSVATVTWARSAHEEILLCRALRVLARAGLPVAVADRGNSAPFAECVRGLPDFHVAVTPVTTLVAQVQDSFRVAAALGTRFILYVEPDKEAFFAHGMVDFLRRAPDDEDVGVVVAARSKTSFDTFPPMQRYTENVINHLCAEVLGLGGDYSYGPFVIRRCLVEHVCGLNHQLGWGWRHSTFRAASRQARRIVHVVGDYGCPQGQQEEDDGERMHRMRQLSEAIHGLTT